MLEKRNVIASTTVDTLRVIGAFSETTVRVCKLNKLSNVLDIISYYASKQSFADCKFMSDDEEERLKEIVEYGREKGIVAKTTESDQNNIIPIEEKPKEEINQTKAIETPKADDPNIEKELNNIFNKYVSYRLTQTNGVYKIKLKTFNFFACIVPVKHEIINEIFHSNKVYIPQLNKEAAEGIGDNPILLLGLDFGSQVMFAWEDNFVRPFIFGGTSKSLYVSSQMIVSGQSSSSIEQLSGRNGEMVYAFRSTLLPEYLLSLTKGDAKILNSTNDKTEPDSKIDKDNTTADKEEKIAEKPIGVKLWNEFCNVRTLDKFIKAKAYRLKNKIIENKLLVILCKKIIELADNQDARNKFIAYNSFDDYPILLSAYLLENEFSLRENSGVSMKYFASLLFDYLAFVKMPYEETKNKSANDNKQNKPTPKPTPIATPKPTTVSTPKPAPVSTPTKPTIKKDNTKYSNGRIYIKFPGGLETTPSNPIDALYAVVSLGEPHRIIKLNIGVGKRPLITKNPAPLRISKYRTLPEGFFMDTEYTIHEIYEIITGINWRLDLKLIVRLVG